jgi:uncharacterized membrane protein YbhN (UPF0104 family)
VSLVCVVGVVAFFHREGIGRALLAFADLDLIVLLVLPLYVLWNWIAAVAWLDLHQMLTKGVAPSSWKLSLIRVQAQAVNLVVPLAGVGGEVVRATMLSRHSGQVAGTTSAVVLDKIADGAAGIVFAFVGVVIGYGQGAHSGLSVAALAGILLLLIGGLPLLLRSHGGRLGRMIARHRSDLSPVIDSPGLVSRGFYRALAWHILERVLTAGEIYLAMLAVGIDVSVVDAVFVAAIMTAYSLIFFFIPGQVGAIEAGIVSAFVSLGLPATAGLTVALVRRARQLLTIAAGTILFLVGKDTEGAANAQSAPKEE